MNRFNSLSQRLRSFAIAATCAVFISHANADRIFYDSFESPVNPPAGTDPNDWTAGGHPSYFTIARENSIWSTPYGEQAISTYSNGIATSPSLDYIQSDGVYTASFNISSSASKGEYRAELWAVTEPAGVGTLLGFVEGDTDGSKNMSFSKSIVWRADSNIGERLELKLMQDPLRSDWHNTPIWDNVAVDFTSDFDITPPTMVDIVADKVSGTIATNTLMTYTVTFSEDMDASTVTAADFGNAGSSLVTIGTVTETTPTSGVFIVQATPTTGASTMRLRINQSAVLKDVVGNSMNTASSIQDNVTFNVEATLPVLANTDIVDNRGGAPVAPNTLVTYTVTFSRDMNASTVTAVDFGNAGSAPVTIGTVTETTPTSGVFTVQATPTGAGTLRLRVNQFANLQDTAANQLNTNPAIADDTTIAVDATAPTLAATDIIDDKEGNPVAAGTLVTYSVIFSENMDTSTVDASDFGNDGTAPVNIAVVSEGALNAFNVEVTPTNSGTLRLRVNAGAVLKDVAGNALVTASAIVDDTTVTVNAGSPYDTWSGGLAFEEDENQDGVSNGMAWMLGAGGATANSTGKLPMVSQSAGNLLLNFTCLKVANRGSSVFKLQYSRDIGVTDPWTGHEAAVPDTNNTVNGVVFTTSANANPNLVNIQATIPASAASPGTKLFARLVVLSAP